MFLNFNDEAQKLLLLALKEKNKLNDMFIGSEHIFLALLSKKNNSLCNILNTFDINYNNFSSFFVVKDEDNYSNYFIFTPLIKNIFKSLGNNTSKKNVDIGVVDIIIEILNNSNSKVVYVLRKLGVDLKALVKVLNSSINKRRITKKSILNDIGVNLNERNSNDVLIGRDEEINEIIEILCCKNKNNPILIGDAGVGKTAIVEEVARRVEKGNVPLKLKNKKIYSVSMSSLVAGTKYRGEFEEKINRLITEVENDEDIILFIDEIHTLVGAGGADGAIDASNILKPSLARGIIKIIGATTKDEYNKYFSDDKALNRRFRVVLCEEPDISRVKEILIGIKSIYEQYHNVDISEDILDKIVYFADKYIKNKKFPDKAIDILDEVCVSASLEGNKEFFSINNLDQKVNDLIGLKNQSLLVGDYKKAIEYSRKEKDVQRMISKQQRKLYNSKKIIDVDENFLLKIMEKKTNIPFYSFKYCIKDVESIFKKYKKESIFKDDVLDKICTNTFELYSSLVNKGLINMMYISSCDENLNNYFVFDYLNTFFKKNHIIYMDVGSFRNIDDLLRCEEKNNLFNEIKLYPFSVFVISNCDNCDYSIKHFFDKINKYGYYIDKHNEKIDFSNSLFIYSIIDKKNIGFNSLKVNYDYINIDCVDMNKLNKYIKRMSIKFKVYLNDREIGNIRKNIVSNYDNLNNIEYLIKKEGLNSSKKSNKKRTMKV